MYNVEMVVCHAIAGKPLCGMDSASERRTSPVPFPKSFLKRASVGTSERLVTFPHHKLMTRFNRVNVQSYQHVVQKLFGLNFGVE